MTSIGCPECGEKILNHREDCPHCHKPLPIVIHNLLLKESALERDGENTPSKSSVPTVNSWVMNIYEEVETLKGQKIQQIKSSIFYRTGWVCLILGIVLISNEMWSGGSLVLTVFLCLMLYPLIRFLLGGKDGLLPMVITFIVEEVLKNKFINILENIGKKDKRKH